MQATFVRVIYDMMIVVVVVVVIIATVDVIVPIPWYVFPL
jgi:hypothetical protein